MSHDDSFCRAPRMVTIVRPMPTDCPVKSKLVEDLLAGRDPKIEPPAKRERKKEFRVLCPPMKDCLTCEGGPCIWQKRSGGRE